ncbi:MAG: A/G-specific adenine glycosylase [Christensenellales bacterium]|jgi:A/G-specific adenine glycosylase
MIALDPAIAAILPEWFEKHARPLPWRRDADPYRVWISEIMLQQTRVETVKGYYERFLAEAPDVYALAALDEARLLKLWEGLGYYSRARNLMRAAQMIVSEYGGAFPDSYDALLKLPGVGAYTAGAIASICFGLPTPAVDGNVLRVIARIAGVSEAIDLEKTKRMIADALSRIYPADQTSEFTQGLIELGATVCLPNGQPKCENCPVAAMCFAYQNDAIAAFPVKSEKKKRRVEEMTVFMLRCGDALAIRKREKRGLLAGLWELPHAQGMLGEKQAWAVAEDWGASPITISSAGQKEHVFTHIEWRMTCYLIDCGARAEDFLWADEEEIAHRYALPTAFRKLLPASFW